VEVAEALGIVYNPRTLWPYLSLRLWNSPASSLAGAVASDSHSGRRVGSGCDRGDHHDCHQKKSEGFVEHGGIQLCQVCNDFNLVFQVEIDE
jgi:hypothetical protein